MHQWWNFRILQKYWGKVITGMSRISKTHIDLSLRLCLLNIWDATDLSRTEKIWVTLGCMVAKPNIVKTWKGGVQPKYSDWESDMDLCMQAERAVYERRGCPHKWTKIWAPWNESRGLLCTPIIPPPSLVVDNEYL